jgi:hypothetical protein
MSEYLSTQQYSFLKKFADENPQLECDGLTTCLSYFLYLMAVPHVRVVGTLSDGRRYIIHQWISLQDGTQLCFRSRMWFGPDAPHGLFQVSGEGFFYAQAASYLPVDTQLLPTILCDFPRYLPQLLAQPETLPANATGGNFRTI